MKQETKNALYEIIKRCDDQLRFEYDVFGLISSLWDIYQRPATGEDSRYKVLGDEIDQHYFRNDDWPQDKLYLSILHIMDDEQRLLKFAEGIININTDESQKEGLQTVLYAEGYELADEDGKLVIRHKNTRDTDGENQHIPFIKCQSTITNIVCFEEKNIEIPKEKECFILTFNTEWNDYGYRTWFRLYYKKSEKLFFLGKVKIMKRSQVDLCDDTSKVIPDHFYRLDDSFCSLGCDTDYYRQMHKTFGNQCYIYLGALRDAALFERTHEEFEEDTIFKTSLLRSNTSERALRAGRYCAFGRGMADAYSFTYRYKPRYDVDRDNPVDINFDFSYHCQPFQRIIGLIGENGVGKSTLLNDIVESFIGKVKNSFVGLPPIMSKIMVMSYSPFDKFPAMHSDETIEYHYCGLLKDKTNLYSQKEQIDVFKKNLIKISHRGSTDHLQRKWKRLMMAVVSKDKIDGFYEINEDTGKPSGLIDKNIYAFCQNMSSGESIYVYTLTEIMANIRYDTLLLLDEPEQHLHPHAVTILMKAIYEVLEDFESYAIIATHSPLIVREMVSDNVYTLDRIGNTLNIAKIGIECFGEDVSVLSDVIFKNMSDGKTYEKFVESVAEECDYDYAKTVERLKGAHNKLGMNMRLLIQSVIYKHSHEEA